jgi:hypothetical protein
MIPTQPMATIHKFGPFRLDADAKILFYGTEPTVLGTPSLQISEVPRTYSNK